MHLARLITNASKHRGRRGLTCATPDVGSSPDIRQTLMGPRDDWFRRASWTPSDQEDSSGGWPAHVRARLRSTYVSKQSAWCRPVNWISFAAQTLIDRFLSEYPGDGETALPIAS
jgi:hypothetical protein